MHIESIQVGRPQTYGLQDAHEPMERPWTTSFYKQPIVGSIQTTRLGLAGDGQADTEHHGGPDKAVCVYSVDNYEFWRQELSLPEPLPFGAFGENLSVRGLSEAIVCIGDQWQAGDVLFEVSQPRQPCWKMARRWRTKDLAYRMQQDGRTGWYFRVLREGQIEAGLPLVLIARTEPTWTIARANEVMYRQKDDIAASAVLAAVETLADAWRVPLAKRAN